jgi:ATP diphosphatase
MTPGRDIDTLIAIMARLRDRENGCAWDIAQTFETIAPFTVEEAYEVADAIRRGDRADLCEELGDLLLQVVYHAQMAGEEGSFSFPDVVEAITTKLIRRHPHVFTQARHLPPDAIKRLWGEIKAAEKAGKAARRAAAGMPAPGVLDQAPVVAPATIRALKLQAAAGTVGFDWNDARAVLDKIREETAEIDEALAEGAKDKVADEVGDLMFAVVNLARHLGVDPEAALERTNTKFVRRFGAIEAALAAEGRSPAQATLDEMEALWVAAKQAERA